MKDKLRIAIIGTVGVPASYGGFETLAHHLVNQLNSKFDLTVFCSSKHYKKERRVSNWNGADLKYIPVKANGVQSIIYDVISMIWALFTSDVMLVLGVSGALFIPVLKLISNKKIIVNIDGQEWKRDKWNKYAKWFLKFSEGIAVKYADEIVADNQAILNLAEKLYGRQCRLIAYGANHVLNIEKTKADFKTYPFLQDDYAFSVCRIEPENNVEMTLEAYTKLPNKVLVFVGNWQNSEYGKNLVKKYGSFKNIYLLNPIYQQAHLDLLRSNCSLYLHGHSAGGTNPSLIEAMYLGLPVMAFNVCYNIETTLGKAIFYSTANELIYQISTKDKVDLKRTAKRLQIIAHSRYTWEFIAKQYAELFDNKKAQSSNTKVIDMKPNYSQKQTASQK